MVTASTVPVTVHQLQVHLMELHNACAGVLPLSCALVYTDEEVSMRSQDKTQQPEVRGNKQLETEALLGHHTNCQEKLHTNLA